MSDPVESLLKTWRDLDITKPPYILPGDRQALERLKIPISVCSDFSEWHQDKVFGQRPSHEFQAGLFPLPYFGNLRKARIFLLTLNPGFSDSDMYAETSSPGLREDLVKNLYQKDLDPTYPAIFLSPKYSWHGGYEYWSKRFSELIKFFQEARSCSFRHSLAFIAQNIAILEAAPYHSTSFNISKKAIDQLASSKAIHQFVQQELVPKALEEKILLIVLRANWFWELNTSTNVIIYKSSESRGSSLSRNSRGGKAIQRFLSGLRS